MRTRGRGSGWGACGGQRNKSKKDIDQKSPGITMVHTFHAKVDGRELQGDQERMVTLSHIACLR